jgi:hypothetical protein
VHISHSAAPLSLFGKYGTPIRAYLSLFVVELVALALVVIIRAIVQLLLIPFGGSANFTNPFLSIMPYMQ